MKYEQQKLNTDTKHINASLASVLHMMMKSVFFFLQK